MKRCDLRQIAALPCQAEERAKLNLTIIAVDADLSGDFSGDQHLQLV